MRPPGAVPENGWNPSMNRQPKFSPPWPAGITSISSRAPWPTSPIHRSPVAGSKLARHGLRSPYAQTSSAPATAPAKGLPAGMA